MHKNMLQYFIVVHRRKSNKMAALINPNFDFFLIFLGNESGHNEHFNGFTCVFLSFAYSSCNWFDAQIGL